jgi:hypothetical protein
VETCNSGNINALGTEVNGLFTIRYFDTVWDEIEHLVAPEQTALQVAQALTTWMEYIDATSKGKAPYLHSLYGVHWVVLEACHGQK